MLLQLYLWRDPPKAVQNFWDTKVTEPRALYDEVESLHMHEVSSSSFPTVTFSVRLTSKNWPLFYLFIISRYYTCSSNSYNYMVYLYRVSYCNEWLCQKWIIWNWKNFCKKLAFKAKFFLVSNFKWHHLHSILTDCEWIYWAAGLSTSMKIMQNKVTYLGKVGFRIPKGTYRVAEGKVVLLIWLWDKDIHKLDYNWRYFWDPKMWKFWLLGQIFKKVT